MLARMVLDIRGVGVEIRFEFGVLVLASFMVCDQASG